MFQLFPNPIRSPKTLAVVLFWEAAATGMQRGRISGRTKRSGRRDARPAALSGRVTGPEPARVPTAPPRVRPGLASAARSNPVQLGAAVRASKALPPKATPREG